MSYFTPPYLAVYAATKHYMTAFTAALTSELAGTGVVVQCLEPGEVDTDMTRLFKEQPRLVKPRAADYVASALRTLGQAGRTCGYWYHSLAIYFLATRLVPGWMMARILEKAGLRQYRWALEKTAGKKVE